MGTPARAQAASGAAPAASRTASQAVVRRAAVAAQIHAVETLLWRAWEAFYAKGLLSISRWRTRGGARDGLIPRRRKAR